MRKIIPALLGCLVLSGCDVTWEGELRYKIVSVDTTQPGAFRLELVGDPPWGLLSRHDLTPRIEYQVYDATVGDEVVCKATQQQLGNPFAYWSDATKISSCKKA